jgi:hypothetical protein
MPTQWHLGNDIVDLTDPRHEGKAGDDRFLRRVFSEEEQKAIKTAENPDRALWMRWAGKEAAFKTISKTRGVPPTFIHPFFRVTVFQPEGPAAMKDPPVGSVENTAAQPSAESGAVPAAEPGDTGPTDPPVTHFGQIRYEDILLPLRIELVGTNLHAVSWTPHGTAEVPPFTWGSRTLTGPAAGWREFLGPRFSTLEWSCVSHRPSALARLAARHSLASTLGVQEVDLEIGCGPGKPGRRIPKVFLRGQELPVDLTLSHHGQLLAWAYLISPQLNGR